MGLTLSLADKALKEDYKDLRDTLNNASVLLSQVQWSTDGLEGRRALHAVRVARNSGIGARADNGTLPTAGNQSYINVGVPTRYLYGRITLTGPVIAAMASDTGSFVRALQSEMDGLKNDLAPDTNRQAWGSADGVIAVCGTTTTSTTVQLATTTTATQMRQLGAGDGGGMVVDIGTVANPTTIASARTVTSYDTANKTITISGATVSTTSSHRVFRSGNGGASSGTGLPNDGQVELTGIQAIVANTGVLHGIDPSTYDVWKSYVDSTGTNRAISENLIDKAIQQVETQSGKTPDLLVSNYGVSRAISNLLKTLRRINDTVELQGGYKGIAWSTLTASNVSGPTALIVDRDCPENSLYGINTKDLVQYVQEDWGWMDQDGAVLSRVSNTDAYEATYRSYRELAAKLRNSHFVIKDISEA